MRECNFEELLERCWGSVAGGKGKNWQVGSTTRKGSELMRARGSSSHESSEPPGLEASKHHPIRTTLNAAAFQPNITTLRLHLSAVYRLQLFRSSPNTSH